MKVTMIVGTLGADAERKSTQNQKEYLSFSVAVNEKNDTTWFNCNLFNKGLVESNIINVLKKGSVVTVLGNYTPRLYQNKKGETVISHDVIVNEVKICYTHKKDDNDSSMF